MLEVLAAKYLMLPETTCTSGCLIGKEGQEHWIDVPRMCWVVWARQSTRSTCGVIPQTRSSIQVSRGLGRCYRLSGERLPSSPWEIHILRSMNHFQSEMTYSSAKLYSGLKPPSIFKTPKMMWILPYIWTWYMSTIFSVTLRKPTICSRDTWTGHCNWGHHTIVKHVIKLERWMQSWRNIVSVRSLARYCSQAHSIHAWKKGRLCHKVMCPWLKRWRKIMEGKDTTTELCDELFNHFVLALKPKWRIQRGNVEAMELQNQISDYDIVHSDDTHDGKSHDVWWLARNDQRTVSINFTRQEIWMTRQDQDYTI